MPTLRGLGDNVEHRLCVKHLYGNFRKRFPGNELKLALWSAARANTVPEFNIAMDELKELNEEAWQEMRQIPPYQRTNLERTSFESRIKWNKEEDLWPISGH